MTNKRFIPNKFQIEFIKNLQKIRFPFCPRRARLTTVLEYLEKNNPELYAKYLSMKK